MEPLQTGGRIAFWTTELVMEKIDQFVKERGRYPAMAELTPRLGMPSDYAIRAKLGMGCRKYCELRYPELNTAAASHVPMRELLDQACRRWIESLPEHPERADGAGFGSYFCYECLPQYHTPEPGYGLDDPDAEQETDPSKDTSFDISMT